MSKDLNYFELLGLKTAYIIDKDLLEKSFFAKQIEFHPDRHIRSDERTKQDALIKSQLINVAYETLRSDFKRAGYILKINQIDIDIEELDSEFLMEAFKWRESLEKNEQPEALKKSIEDSIDKTMQKLGLSLEKSLYESAKKEYIIVRFLKRFSEEIAKTIAQ
jgi:molecular chaperone HscB